MFFFHKNESSQGNAPIFKFAQVTSMITSKITMMAFHDF